MCDLAVSLLGHQHSDAASNRHHWQFVHQINLIQMKQLKSGKVLCGRRGNMGHKMMLLGGSEGLGKQGWGYTLSLMAVPKPPSTIAPIQTGLDHVPSSQDIRVRRFRGGRARAGRKPGPFCPALPICPWGCLSRVCRKPT